MKMSLCLVACLILSLQQKVMNVNAKTHRMDQNQRESNLMDPRDQEWNEMVNNNPYPDVCSGLESTTSLRLCILEHKWSIEMPINRRRAEMKNYNFLSEVNRIIPLRKKTDPDNQYDCLISDRDRMREVPFHCYDPRYSDLKKDRDAIYKFLSEVMNELRFTFDYVLYDDTGNTHIEDKFWYLALYLKKVVKEIPNPYTIAKTINAAQNDSINFVEDIAELHRNVQDFSLGLRDQVYRLSSSFETLKGAIGL